MKKDLKSLTVLLWGDGDEGVEVNVFDAALDAIEIKDSNTELLSEAMEEFRQQSPNANTEMLIEFAFQFGRMLEAHDGQRCDELMAQLDQHEKDISRRSKQVVSDEQIRKALTKANGNKTRAADNLGICRQQIYNRIKQMRSNSEEGAE